MNWFGFNVNAFLWIFIILNVANVVIQTIKSIATVKWGAWAAAITNAIAYGLYTIVVIYMNADGLGVFWKAVIIGVANLIGVYVVKVFEIKSRKDRLWKVEATVKRTDTSALDDMLYWAHISHNYLIAGDKTIFNCYCENQKQSTTAKKLLTNFNAKYFVIEEKVRL